MYAVVGCRECSALWIVEGRPETTQCPRCGHRRQYAKLKKFVSTDDEAHAREVRASMLAARQDEGDAFAGTDSYAEMESQLDDVGVDDEEYLERSGIDPGEVAAAGDRAREGTGGSRSRPEVIRAAVRETDGSREAVREYAEERGVPATAATELLERLVDRGEAVEGGEGYRLL